MSYQPVFQTDLPFPLFVRGKVRDTYDLGKLLLIVATDRVSAFDVVLPNPVPQKGFVLNQLSAFWFDKTKHIIPNHMVKIINESRDLAKYMPGNGIDDIPQYLDGRAMVVKKASRFPVECIVRGYLAGSAWEEYRKSGTACGIALPRGYKQSEILPEPVFTPTTKADTGHDTAMTLDEMKNIVGDSIAEEIKNKSIAIYTFARDYARQRGIIIADTKMEFGMNEGKLILIDELLTPDSSRFWEASQYEVGKSQPSYDKQPLRDWLTASGWNKEPPAPQLPPDVVAATSRLYRQAYEKLTGNNIL